MTQFKIRDRLHSVMTTAIHNTETCDCEIYSWTDEQELAPQNRESRNNEDYEADLAQRTPTLKEVLLRMRKVHIKEMDRLQARVNVIDKRVDELELEEMKAESCRSCGQAASHYFHDPLSLNGIDNGHFGGHEFVGRE